jgi:hypothetical protein
MTNLFKEKITFTERFKQRHSLRLHMSMILMATVFSGFLATRIMLAMNLENIMLRYPLTVAFAYLVFIIAVKLWLKYVAVSPPAKKLRDNPLDAVDLAANISFPSPSGGTFHGGGGAFDGGGASDSFSDAGATLADGIDTSGSIGDAVGDAAGDVAAGALGDEGGVVAIVVFAALAAVLAVVVGAGAYLVYEAPFILSEAAFEFILAAGLLRGSRKIDEAGWVGSVIKTTWIPFAVTMGLAAFAASLIQNYSPGVTRLSELFSRL